MILFDNINTYLAFALVSFAVIALTIAFNDELLKLETSLIAAVRKIKKEPPEQP